MVSFDNVPWVVTIKRNDHYFPTVEWIKDSNESCGWRRVSYEFGRVIDGEGQEGAPNAAGEAVVEMDVDGVDPDVEPQHT